MELVFIASGRQSPEWAWHRYQRCTRLAVVPTHAKAWREECALSEAGVLQGGGKWPKRMGGYCRSLVEDLRNAQLRVLNRNREKEEDLSAQFQEGSLERQQVPLNLPCAFLLIHHSILLRFLVQVL